MSDQAFNDWYDRYFDEAIEKYAGLDTTNPKGIAQDAWDAAIEADRERRSEPVTPLHPTDERVELRRTRTGTGGDMTTKHDGGPAFPESGPRGVAVGGEGMTLRDAMALSVRMPDEFAARWAAALVGSPQPSLNAEPIEHIDWWARVEAAYRYRIADAMLKAREEE